MVLVKLLLLCFVMDTLWANDKLVIISPHRKSIQEEFVRSFKDHYKNAYKKVIEVEWVDQGGSENDLRFVLGRYNKIKTSSGIDVFWGGGDLTFYDLEEKNLLIPYKVSQKLQKDLPSKIMGLSLRSDSNHWYSTALSTFGIFYNKKILKYMSFPEPKTWEDLADPLYKGYVSVADPRHSSSSLVMSIIILEAFGWEKGWKILTQIAANVDKFEHSSSDPIKAVVSGQVAAATAIDFYAQAKISHLGSDSLGFSVAPGKTIFNSDPVGILKGAEHLLQAQRFVDFLLSPRAQKLFVLPKGAPGGPRNLTLGRIAIHPDVYKNLQISKAVVNPFKIKNKSFHFDMKKFTKIKTLISDLIGVYHVASHSRLKKAWAKIVARGLKADAVEALTQIPVSKKEVLSLSSRWHEPNFRNKVLTSWAQDARRRYQALDQENIN